MSCAPTCLSCNHMSSRLLLDRLYLASSNPYSSFKPVGSSELPSLKLSDATTERSSLTTSSGMKSFGRTRRHVRSTNWKLHTRRNAKGMPLLEQEGRTLNESSS